MQFLNNSTILFGHLRAITAASPHAMPKSYTVQKWRTKTYSTVLTARTFTKLSKDVSVAVQDLQNCTRVCIIQAGVSACFTELN